MVGRKQRLLRTGTRQPGRVVASGGGADPLLLQRKSPP